MQDDAFMRLAFAQAELALAKGEVPVGAVVVREGQVIAQAHNRREETGNPLHHAEMLAMEQAAQALNGWRLNECTLYVTLEPCPMCAGAMVMAQLGRLVYGAYDESQGCCGSVYLLVEDPAFHARTRCLGGVMEEQCSGLLKRFFQGKRQPCPSISASSETALPISSRVPTETRR